MGRNAEPQSRGDVIEMVGRGVYVILLLIGLSVIAACQGGEQLKKQLEQKEKEIQELKAQIDQLKAQLEEAKKKVAAAPKTEVKAAKLVCADCHKEVSKFHNVKTIMKIDEAKNITPPRICTTCHGEVKKVHTIHEKKLKSGEMKCETCHLAAEGTFKIPQPRPQDTLVCELCHYDGKYIDIHKGKCERCHYGGISGIHKNVLEKRTKELLALAEVESS